jgi:hypothetical protein
MGGHGWHAPGLLRRAWLNRGCHCSSGQDTGIRTKTGLAVKAVPLESSDSGTILGSRAGLGLDALSSSRKPTIGKVLSGSHCPRQWHQVARVPPAA